MKKTSVLFLFWFCTLSLFAQNRISLFIGNANQYASVDLSDYRKRLRMEYNVGDRMLDDYYRRCGNDWGNVGLLLEIARSSRRDMRDVFDYYSRYRRHGWDRVLIEIGIRPGSVYYNPFYDRLHHHSEYWHKHYCSYCDRHHHHHYKKPKYKKYKKYKKHHHKKNYRRDRWYDDDDDDDDDDD